jgi:hypothetical protein
MLSFNLIYYRHNNLSENELGFFAELPQLNLHSHFQTDFFNFNINIVLCIKWKIKLYIWIFDPFNRHVCICI